MDRKAWKVPAKEDLKEAYNNRGKYPDQNNRRYIFTELGNDKLWKVTDKSHKVRLLPVHPIDNINFYGMTVHIHTNVGVNGDQYLCLKRMKNVPCPICEHQVSLWDAEPDMAKDLYPSTRYLVWMVDLSLSKDKQVAQIWSCPRTAMDTVLGVSYKKATDEILNLANIDDGIAIYFDREKKKGTTFSTYVNFQLDDNPIPATDKWLEGIVSFSDIIEYATYNEIKNAFLGISDEVSPKKDVSSSVETTVRSETKNVVEDGSKSELIETTTKTLSDLSRDGLEALALTVLSNDYEESEIEEMGTKKLRRLVQEAVEKRLDSPKEKDVSPSIETTISSGTKTVAVDEPKISEAPSPQDSIHEMGRDELEASAITVLSEDFEESEIEEMSTKKLRRLLKEAVEKKLDSSDIKTVKHTFDNGVTVEELDPKEVLKRKLKERVGG